MWSEKGDYVPGDTLSTDCVMVKENRTVPKDKDQRTEMAIL